MEESGIELDAAMLLVALEHIQMYQMDDGIVLVPKQLHQVVVRIWTQISDN